MKIDFLTVAEGETAPAGWGLAWIDERQAMMHVLPIPLNFIVGTLVRFWWTLKSGPRRSLYQQAMIDNGWLRERIRLRGMELRTLQREYNELEANYRRLAKYYINLCKETEQ